MRLLLAFLFFIVAASHVPAQDAAAPNRVENLLARMTLEEKVGQLVMTGFDAAFGTDILARGGAGSLISFNDAAAIARAQGMARTSRLGIPLLVGLDLLHGFRTLFPMPLAEAATFDPARAARTAELAAREAVPAGINWTFAPMVDIGRDARWGRIVEGSGEDVKLSSDLAAARAEGFRKGGVAPTLKHFLAYGAVTGGRDYDAVSVPDIELWNVHLPPFRAALGPGTVVMTALTALNGIPAAADRRLVQDVLRGALRFDGVVLSDWGSIEGLVKQGVAADGPDAVRKAMAAGIDIDMASGFYARYLADEVRAGRIPVSAVDAAVRRVLTLKEQLGLFEAPPADPKKAEASAVTPELRRSAREAAADSLVLLQNRDDLLPIPPTTTKIAVVGPFSDNAFDQLGPHEARGRPEEAVTILQGITERARRNGAEVSHAAGCDAECTDDTGFPAAEAAARAADLVIAVLGEKREHSGEGASRSTLDFPGKQMELLETLAATGKPVILLVVAGRPLDLRLATKAASAVVMTWYPGTEGGNGIADVLFGDRAPSAKLPISWPRSVGQVPTSYDRPASARPHDPKARYSLRFLDDEITPLFPFGHGLTYTRFAFADLAVAPARITKADTSVTVSVDITNTGTRAGTQIAQLYLRDEVASRVLPLRRLRAYRRVDLAPGETKTVRFKLGADDLSFFDESGARVIEPGTFRIGVGGDSTVDLPGVLTFAPATPRRK